MNEEIKKIKVDIENIINNVNDKTELNNCRIEYLGKKGKLTKYASEIVNMKQEEKKEFGILLNIVKTDILKLFSDKEKELDEKELLKKINAEKVDVTLPGTKVTTGSANIIERLIEEFEDLFISMGYDIVEGPEVEEDLYNFELLNLPKGHPARDAQDTFYIEGESILLRSQTSPVQIRTMLANKEKTPIRVLCPGKTYRRDADDATHSHQFTQIEGLLVDKNVSLADLKGTFDIIAKKLYGDDRRTRFRPSFYPFTEPSVELDISCFNCNEKGCAICKNTGWITVGGAGMVHPNVLTNCGYDKNKYTGFAFGFGAERLAMLKYGITDIRTFYNNDLRVSKQFNRREM